MLVGPSDSGPRRSVFRSKPRFDSAAHMSMKIELRRTVYVHLDSHFLSTSFWAVMTGPFHGLSR